MHTGAMAQAVKFKNLKSINVGARNETMVKVMFTTPKEEYFYSTFKDVKIKKVNISKMECKIRKSDSICVELTILVSDPKQAKKLFKLAKHDFGKPVNKVFKTTEEYDWVWNEVKHDNYIESKAWHNLPDHGAVLKIILIQQ